MPGSRISRIEKQSALPIYQQIKEDIRRKIRENEWLPGQKVPSENKLVSKLGVSRMTVHRALRELTHEGLLNRVHGLGTFVAEPARHASLIRLQDIAEEVSAAGGEYRCRVLCCKPVRATGELAKKMAVSVNSTLYHLRVVHYQDDVPIQLEDRLVNPAVAPEFIDIDFSRRTATDYLVNLLKPDEMEHIVTAILPGNRTAKLLKIEATEPCIKLQRRTWKDRHVVTQVSLIYPGSRYDLKERYRTDTLTTIEPENRTET